MNLPDKTVLPDKTILPDEINLCDICFLPLNLASTVLKYHHSLEVWQNWENYEKTLHLSSSLGKKDVRSLSQGQWTWFNNDILLPKLFWPTVRKNCFNDWEKLFKFEVEGREFANFLILLEQFIQREQGQNNFW